MEVLSFGINKLWMIVKFKETEDKLKSLPNFNTLLNIS